MLRFNNQKRLYKLIIRYFEDVLHASTSSLPAPNLQLIAKADPGAEHELCTLVGLVLALVVQSNGKEAQVQRIQRLEEWVQRELMMAIEQVRASATIVERDVALSRAVKAERLTTLACSITRSRAKSPQRTQSMMRRRKTRKWPASAPTGAGSRERCASY